MTGEQMLHHVAGIIAERGAAYGDAATSMTAVAARWSITLGHPVTPAQVLLCLVDLSTPRAQSNTRGQHRGRDRVRRVAVRNHERCELQSESNAMIRVRKRKPGRRYPCGKRIREETEREAMATALDARRRHYGGERARDERLGTALGRLAFRGEISDKQCQAGLAFADLYRRHHMAMGLPLPSPPSVASILINEGIFGSSPSEPMLDAIERLKNRFEEAADALDQCDREHSLAAGRRPTLLVYRAVCADEDTASWPYEDLGNLRVALNALVRVFRL